MKTRNVVGQSDPTSFFGNGNNYYGMSRSSRSESPSSKETIGRRKFIKGFAAIPAAAIASRYSSRLHLPSDLRPPCPADYINSILSTVQDWSGIVDIGTVMGMSTNEDYDTWIQAVAEERDWCNVFLVKSHAEHSGYSSSTIDDCVKLALSNALMFEEYSIPVTENDDDGEWFWPFCKYVLYGYRYAQELDWETDRWDANKAFGYLSLVYDSYGTAFYKMNDQLNQTSPESVRYAEQMPYGTRWLELGKLMGCFLIFYEMGINNALSYALKCWNQLNDDLWKTNHFTYATGWFGYEFSAMDVIVDSIKLNNRLTDQLTALPDAGNIFTDIESRYLSGYGSAQWSGEPGNTAITQHLRISNDGYLVVAYPSNPQLRLDGTLNAWILLHLTQGKLSGASQTIMTGMLEGNGTTRAFDGLMESRLMKNSGFMITDDSASITDIATAMGAMCLFLNSIAVNSGAGLAIPLITDNENDHAAMNSYHFGFNYQNSQIKIPVWAGTTLNFLFGANPVQLSFQTTGVYQISFTWDWNSILDCQFVSSLNPSEAYLSPYELS